MGQFHNIINIICIQRCCWHIVPPQGKYSISVKKFCRIRNTKFQNVAPHGRTLNIYWGLIHLDIWGLCIATLYFRAMSYCALFLFYKILISTKAQYSIPMKSTTVLGVQNTNFQKGVSPTPSEEVSTWKE